MKQNLKRAFTKDIGLKILALVFSFLLWLVVVNIDDPTQTRTFTAVVSVTNEDVLTEAGKLYEFKNGVNTVSFRVTAKRSIIERLSSSDFTATADMNYLESDERVPVTVSARSYASSITISSQQNYIYVVVEDEATKKFVISAETTGTLNSDLAIESVETAPTVVTISGPEEKVSKIAGVKAVIDITGVTGDVTENVVPQIYDSDGNEMDTSKLNLSVATVGVSVDFTNIKTVDLNVKTSGSLREDLVLGSITTDPATVTLKGDAAALNEISAITIPDTVINLSDLTGSYSTVVDISAYIPEGVSLTDSSNSKVTVSVLMQGQESQTVTVPTNKITFTNLAEDLTAKVAVDSVSTNIFGTAHALNSFDVSTVQGYIDCSGFSAGEQQAIIHFTDTDDVTIQNCSVTIKITGGDETETEATSSQSQASEATGENEE